MNIDLLFPTLTGELLKPAQPDQAGTDGGQEFEDMLVQQSKAQQENSRPQKKTEAKKAPEKAEQKSTQEDEAPEEGNELAAALVTSQPVMPIAPFDAAQVTVAEDGTVILEPAVVEEVVTVEAAAPAAAEAMPEAAPQEELPQQAAETVEVKEPVQQQQQAPRQEEPKAEVRTEETGVQEAEKPEASARRVQPDAKPKDEEPEVEVEQQSQPVFRDVKAAPVKVADVHSEVDVEEPEAPQQIAGNVIRALEQGQDVVRIQLNPANLGSVTIELSRSAAGELTIVMNPETVRAANILTQHSSSLMAVLMDNGEATVNITVNMPENTENAGMMMNPDGHNSQNPEDEDDEKRKKRQPRTEGVNAADFLSQLRLGLVGTAGTE